MIAENQNKIQNKQIQKQQNIQENIQKHDQKTIVLSIQALNKKRQYYSSKQDQKNMIMVDMQRYFKQKLRSKLDQGYFNIHSIIPSQDKDYIKICKIFKQMTQKNKFDPKIFNLQISQQRGIASILGMAVGDALGSCTQFEHYVKQGMGLVKSSFKDIHNALKNKKISARLGQVQIWTDDASMGLAMADSILLTDYYFNPQHLRYMFTLWLNNGLDNGGRPYSIGLGGNISISMSQFQQQQNNFAKQLDRNNSGNGSLMRLAPIPVAFSNNQQLGIKYAGLQSLTTHNGIQAYQCSRLMSKIIIRLINRKQKQDGKQLLVKICKNYKTNVQSVRYLAYSLQQPVQLYKKQCQEIPRFKQFNKSVKDRNWNWMDKNFTYSPYRAENNPGYVGSYCMDALAMALHTVYYSKNLVQLLARNADLGGDCDSVGSIAGQIGGALYGLGQNILRLYCQTQDCLKGRYHVFSKGYMLAKKTKL